MTTSVTDGITEPSSVLGGAWGEESTCRPAPWWWGWWGDWSPGWDLMLEMQQTSSFRLTLIGPDGSVATDGSFVVHTCPRAEHETEGLGSTPGCSNPNGLASTQACTDLAVATPSGTGTVDVTLNQSGSARGYMGIELTKAPIAPGTYYVWVESLDQAYRVREGSQLVGLTADDEYRGGFEICTVMGAEILDENFQKVQDLSVDQPTQAFLRVIDPTQALDTFDVSLTTLDSKNEILSNDVSVPVSRIGSSRVFIGPLVFTPRGYQASTASVRATSVTLADISGPQLLAECVHSFAQIFRAGVVWTAQELRVRPKLAIQWLDEQGKPFAQGVTPTQVTRIEKICDPEEDGHFLYSENTWVQVAATTWGGLPVGDANGSVRLDEEINKALPSQSFFFSTPNWQYSYQGEFGQATNLRPDRPTGDPTLAIPLTNGLTNPVALVSLAGPRATGPYSPFKTTWDATLLPCDAEPGTPCETSTSPNFAPSATLQVAQWVDQQVYGRHAAGSGFNRWTNADPANPGNDIPDWLEAMAWDTLSNYDSSDYPAVVQQAVETPQVVDAELTGKPATNLDTYAAFEDEPTGTKLTNDCPADPGWWELTFYPGQFDEDAFRWDKAYVRYLYGIRIEEAHALTDTVLHEARHGWQRWIAECGGPLHATRAVDDLSDQDDLLSNPVAATGDLFAARLADAASAEIIGSAGNPETHLYGPTISDHGSFNLSVVIERDAECFPSRAESDGTACPGVTSVVHAVELSGIEAPPGKPIVLTSNPIIIARDTWMQIDVSVSAERGSEGSDPNQTHGIHQPVGLGPCIVVFEVTQGGAFQWAAETPVPNASVGTKVIGITDENGKAWAQFTPLATGTYMITVTNRAIVPEGTSLGDQFQPLTIQLEVQ